MLEVMENAIWMMSPVWGLTWTGPLRYSAVTRTPHLKRTFEIAQSYTDSLLAESEQRGRNCLVRPCHGIS